MRWLIAHTALDLGLQPLVVDSDLVVLRDPFSALVGDADFEFSTDHYFPDRHLWQPWARPEEHLLARCHRGGKRWQHPSEVA